LIRICITVVTVLILSGILLVSAGSIGLNSPAAQTGQGRVLILLYHSVNDSPIGMPDLTVTTAAFEEQMRYLSEHGYTAIDFSEIGKLPQNKKPVIITFDDGYADNYTNAYPILKKYHIRATVFLIAKAVGARGFLTQDEMKEMGDLVSFQSHTTDSTLRFGTRY
jgi:peptidoglycan/xylan/chitin deacetylase (PgdA/CDA1 family)